MYISVFTFIHSMEPFIVQFGFMIIAVMILTFVMKLLRQPLIIGYVLGGFLFSFIVASAELDQQMNALSQLGIIFLLFLMGLEFDLRTLKYLGKDVFLATLIQSVLFFGIGIGAGLLFSLSISASVVVGLIFMFSSTLLVAKWVDDKKEQQQLHGKLILGTLIIQDIIAILSISSLKLFQDASLTQLFVVPASILLLLSIAVLLSRFVLNSILKFASKFPELLFFTSLAVCFTFIEISLFIGISESLGAFIAGVTLANTIYRSELAAKLKPLLTFFHIIFFISLGFALNVSVSMHFIVIAAVLALISLLIRPIITYITLRLRGYEKKASILTSLNLAPLSEFGIILVYSAVSLGVVDSQLEPLIILATIFSMLASTYINKFDKQLFTALHPFVNSIDFLHHKDHEVSHNMCDAHVVLFGNYEFGKELLQSINQRQKKILVIDSDPQNLEQLRRAGIAHQYGSVIDPDFLTHLHFANLEVIISSGLDKEDALVLLKHIKPKYPKALCILQARKVKDAIDLYDAGADYVLYPTYVNEQQVSIIMEEYGTQTDKLLAKKIAELEKFKSTVQTQQGEFSDIDTFIHKIFQR